MIPITKQIKFNEALHQYTDEDNKVYTSVTTLIQKYYPKFDESFWAKKKAKELGVSVEVVKASWKVTRDTACERGNVIHKELEDSINESNSKSKLYFDGEESSTRVISYDSSSLTLLAETPLAKKYPEIYKFLACKISEGWILFAEQRIYWHEYLIAGTIDCPLVNPLTKEFIIVDWKTNKDELKFKSGYYKKVNNIKTDTWIDKKEYFFYPLHTLENCKGNIYTMQLSLYAYLLELWGYKCISLVLFHIRKEGLIEKVQPPINISYREQDAQNILNHFKTNNNSPKSIELGIF